MVVVNKPLLCRRLQHISGQRPDATTLPALQGIYVRHGQPQLVLVQVTAVSQRSVLRLLQLSHPGIHRRALYRGILADAV